MEKYTYFLLAESKYSGCCRLSEILDGLSHDSVNRFLLRERYEPKDLEIPPEGQVVYLKDFGQVKVFQCY